jgi:hypothetical protein
MDDVSVAALLHDASVEIPVHRPPAEAIMRAGRRRAAWRRAGAGVLTMAAASVLTAAVAVTRVGGADPAPTPGPLTLPPAAAPANTGCVARLAPALLPEWARDGFSDPEPRVPYVTSGSGRLVAILFTDGLYAPPRQGQANKILWVTPIPNSPAGPLTISAQREGTSEIVTREVPNGPGPSTVDLPGPGCWHLTLRWGQATDVMDLRYVSP